MTRRWILAAGGLVIAALGGDLELGHHVAAGAALVVVGLVTWVVASGSAVAEPAPLEDPRLGAGWLRRGRWAVWRRQPPRRPGPTL